MEKYDIIDNIEEFDWDDGNITKNWVKHHVSAKEAEEVFFNTPLLLAVDQKHSSVENRYIAFGMTDENRPLTIVFTMRGNKIRVIMARVMSRKERSWFYEQETDT